MRKIKLVKCPYCYGRKYPDYLNGMPNQCGTCCGTGKVRDEETGEENQSMKKK